MKKIEKIEVWVIEEECQVGEEKNAYLTTVSAAALITIQVSEDLATSHYISSPGVSCLNPDNYRLQKEFAEAEIYILEEILAHLGFAGGSVTQKMKEDALSAAFGDEDNGM